MNRLGLLARSPRDADPPPETGNDVSPPAAPGPPAFVSVYREHFHEVCRWLSAMGCRESDLEDVAQDVFLVVRRKLPTFDGRKLLPWIYGIALREARDHRRRAWFRRLLLGLPAARQEAVPDPDRGPAELLEEKEARQQFEAVLGRMSTIRRTTFVLFEIEGYSTAEIARLQGIPEATVRTRLFHARREFRARFEDADRDGRRSTNRARPPSGGAR